MKHLIVAMSCLAILCGCGSPYDAWDALAGSGHKVAVVTSRVVELSATTTNIDPSEAAEVFGNTSQICVVLAGGVSRQASEAEVTKHLAGAVLEAVVTTDDERTYSLSCPGSSWSLRGNIVPDNEIAACVSLGCAEDKMVLGAMITSVAITSTRPVRGLGVYWESINAPEHGN